MGPTGWAMRCRLPARQLSTPASAREGDARQALASEHSIDYNQGGGIVAEESGAKASIKEMETIDNGQ